MAPMRNWLRIAAQTILRAQLGDPDPARGTLSRPLSSRGEGPPLFPSYQEGPVSSASLFVSRTWFEPSDFMTMISASPST